MSKSSNRKLRILCLHGYRQNGEAFRDKLGAFRKIVKPVAELVFIDAPHVIKPSDDASNNGNQRGWWFSLADDTFSAREDSDISKGFDESVQLVAEVFVNQGPFAGILGFSQGAAMVAMLCALRETEIFPHGFQFVILVAGFRSRSSQHAQFYSSRMDVRSLHVIGEADKVIPQEMSDDLLPCFNSPTIVRHPGGHFVPSSGHYKHAYRQFLEQELETYF